MARATALALALASTLTLASAANVCTPVCFGGSTNCQTSCPPSKCGAQEMNLGGNLIQLDVNSMQYTHGGMPPAAPSAAACCAKCDATAGCNGWTFCNNPKGCGKKGACTAYLASLPADKRKAPLGFGEFGGCDQADGQWPYQMCSLKKVADPKNPVVYGKGAAALGFVSGVKGAPAPAPAGCPVNLAPQACATCSLSKAPAQCRACLASKAVDAASAGDGGMKAASICAMAANMTHGSKAQQTAFKCLATNGLAGVGMPLWQDCGGCFLYGNQPGKLDVAASEKCFACTAGTGDLKNSGCGECFDTKRWNAGFALDKCVACASNLANDASTRRKCADNTK